MSIILVGLNHQTATIECREKLALSGQALQLALMKMKTPQHIDSTESNGCHPSPIYEGVILSTCNRLEIYAVVENKERGWEFIECFLSQYHDISLNEIEPYLYRREGKAVVNHLMRVTCGLDSMILGEPQILGQVSQAYNAAQEANVTGPVLSHLFSQAVHVGKRARTDTEISRFTTSVSHAGVKILLENIAEKSPNILIVGAGDVARVGAKLLQKHDKSHLAFINRSHARAESMAQEFGGLSMGWGQLNEALRWADAVLTATGAPHIVITKQTVEEALSTRNGRPLLFVDIAVPRDVEAAVDTLDGVKRFDIDDLQSIVDSNTAQREAAVPQVEHIITEEISGFYEWYHSREVAPVITSLRRLATEVAQLEIDQALNKLGDADEHTTKIINQLAHRIVNKILHEPTIKLRGQAAEGNGCGYAHAISELFGLHDDNSEVAEQPLEANNDCTLDVSQIESGRLCEL